MDSIKLNSKSIQTKSNIHLMPCKISYDGKSDIQSFFTNSIIESDENNVLANAFRGRPLNGLHLDLPESTIGIVLNDETDAKNKRQISVETAFTKIYTWQLDNPKISPATDPFAKAMNEWFSVADVVIFLFLVSLLYQALIN
jgi:hypothetical protein